MKIKIISRTKDEAREKFLESINTKRMLTKHEIDTYDLWYTWNNYKDAYKIVDVVGGLYKILYNGSSNWDADPPYIKKGSDISCIMFKCDIPEDYKIHV